jgi:hypothetical protein
MLFGQDAMMIILLTYLMIGPSGAALSVDRWLKKRKAGPEGAPLVPLTSANLAIRLMQVHFCIIYGASGLSKLQGSAWWNGTALWSTIANYSFAPMNIGLYNDFLIFISKHRWLWEILLSGGALFTLFLEIGFPFLVWVKRWRWIMVSGAVLLHTGIGLSMGLITFSLFMLTMLYSFIPPEATRQMVTSASEQARRLFTRRESVASPQPAVAAQ